MIHFILPIRERVFSALKKKILVALLLGLCLFSGCAWFGTYDLEDIDHSNLSFYQSPKSGFVLPTPKTQIPERIILLIGDGMGYAQVDLARHRGAGERERLWMETLPVTGKMTTQNVDEKVTDSAASVTAIACGVKTKNKKIGQTSDGQKWYTILELLQQRGFRTGLVATSGITHATPAGFASHVSRRSNQTEIAEQMLAQRVDVLFGGGRKYWLPQLGGGTRLDRRNLLEEAQQAGYTVVQTPRQFRAVSSLPVLGLFNKSALTTVQPEPSVAELTSKAIELLGRQSRFFLMVEGSQIDWAGHANDEEACIRQTLLFDMAVRKALEFAAKDGRTLVIVTSDHETGGLQLRPDPSNPRQPKAKWTTGEHTNVKVPLYAYGPGAQYFAGLLDNTDISKKIAALMGIKNFPRKRN